MKNAPIFRLSLLMCLSAACGGDDEAPLSKRGVPADKMISQLTADEHTQFCRNRQDYDQAVNILGFKQSTCKVEAYLGAIGDHLYGTQVRCKELYESCVAAAKVPINASCVQERTCNATVAEVEECLLDLIESRKTLANKYPVCENLNKSYLENQELNAPMFSEPAACILAKGKCPGLMGF